MTGDRYRQVELRAGPAVLVTYVPEGYAVEGRRLTLTSHPGRTWVVAEVYDNFTSPRLHHDGCFQMG